jgi:hypothetical protein
MYLNSALSKFDKNEQKNGAKEATIYSESEAMFLKLDVSLTQ